ncbi:hypothetical protein JWG39_09435 [Desulforhopalus vacuolatus]|uniref:hypothetical protein n=1 Tax=Desulforhopalus vacuolatus TaxID=40414 RepID=UPI001962E1E0|nr:hypothetical protein [Desulforhopalus vacuolatus]MBM9520035.1 hypothetical protein [Desulforhopalus vacuolatus]
MGGRRRETGEREKRKTVKQFFYREEREEREERRRRAKKGEKLLRIKIKKGRWEAGDKRREAGERRRETGKSKRLRRDDQFGHLQNNGHFYNEINFTSSLSILIVHSS